MNDLLLLHQKLLDVFCPHLALVVGDDVNEPFLHLLERDLLAGELVDEGRGDEDGEEECEETHQEEAATALHSNQLQLVAGVAGGQVDGRQQHRGHHGPQLQEEEEAVEGAEVDRVVEVIGRREAENDEDH